MLNGIIKFSLQHRLLILCTCLGVIVVGASTARTLPIDVLPDLTRPRVTLITECPGYAPEEVEQLVTIPIESAINGASGVLFVRATSDIGLSVVNVEFDWGTDIYIARQIVQERLSTISEQLPEGVRPHFGPISSLLGQIMLIGMYSPEGTVDPMEVRTLGDWVVRKRLLAIPGISQVITMGGGRKQYHVLVKVDQLQRFDVTMREIEHAIRRSNANVTGGYVDQNARELLVRGMGRAESVEDLKRIVVKQDEERSVQLGQIAEIREVPQPKRGDSAVNGRDAVVLTIQKQPQADTRRLTETIHEALDGIRASLPNDVQLEITYEQRTFIDHSVHNVLDAIRDGAILVIIILFLFLLNFRTTFITLTAIPLSILVTVLCFRWFEMSINVMTLGGIAVALGELVDDAIVDVENIFRRLKQNAQLANPRPAILVIYEASVEVRNAIVVSTMLVIVVFAPLFALSGMEGRLFVPLAIAYIVAILASTVVSLTLTPVLSYYLLPRAKATVSRGDALVLRTLKRLATPVIRFSMDTKGLVAILVGALVSIGVSVVLMLSLGQDFLPDFDEGAAQVNLFAVPGTSLTTSGEIRKIADQQFLKLLETPENPKGPIRYFTCKTGRAEQDEHVMGVHISEYVMTLNPNSGLTRDELIAALHEAADQVPGVEVEVEQPIAHLISHILSGVTAQIAIKVFGDDLDGLRRTANDIESTIEDIPGIAPPFVEQQTHIPQLRIKLVPEQLAKYGLTGMDVTDIVETALHGRVVSRMIEGQRFFDIVVRFDEVDRRDFQELRRLPIRLADGGIVPLSAVADIHVGAGPNAINRENGRRRIVVRVNTMDRDVGSAVREIRSSVDENVTIPESSFVVYGGQFEAQRAATRRILALSAVALIVVFAVLFSSYPSVSIVLQILMALPTAFLGGIIALWLSGQSMSVASLVGFVSLAGIATRNGLLLISTYLGLVPQRGFTKEMVLEGSLERLAPVLMTALTTGLGLVPIAIGGHLPGNEILYPIATVMLGGLATSSLGEFLIRPGLFYMLSRKSVERLLSQERVDFDPTAANREHVSRAPAP